MDLELMKQTWSEVNNQFEKQKKLNAQLIISMTHEHTTNRLNKMLYYEKFSIACYLISGMYFIPRLNQLDTSLSYWSGIGFILLSAVFLILSVIFLLKAAKINIYKYSLKNVLCSVCELKLFYRKYKIAAWISLPFYSFSVAAILIKLYHKKDIITDFNLFITPISICLAISIPLMYFIYKHIYEKNMQEIESLLKDIRTETAQ